MKRDGTQQIWFQDQNNARTVSGDSGNGLATKQHFSYHDPVYTSQSTRQARLGIICCVRRFIFPKEVEHTTCLLERASATLYIAKA